MATKTTKFYNLNPGDYHPGDIVEDRLSLERGVVRAARILPTGATLLTVYYASRHLTREYNLTEGGQQLLNIVLPYFGGDPRNSPRDPRATRPDARGSASKLADEKATVNNSASVLYNKQNKIAEPSLIKFSPGDAYPLGANQYRSPLTGKSYAPVIGAYERDAVQNINTSVLEFMALTRKNLLDRAGLKKPGEIIRTFNKVYAADIFSPPRVSLLEFARNHVQIDQETAEDFYLTEITKSAHTFLSGKDREVRRQVRTIDRFLKKFKNRSLRNFTPEVARQMLEELGDTDSLLRIHKGKPSLPVDTEEAQLLIAALKRSVSTNEIETGQAYGILIRSHIDSVVNKLDLYNKRLKLIDKSAEYRRQHKTLARLVERGQPNPMDWFLDNLDKPLALDSVKTPRASFKTITPVYSTELKILQPYLPNLGQRVMHRLGLPEISTGVLNYQIDKGSFTSVRSATFNPIARGLIYENDAYERTTSLSYQVKRTRINPERTIKHLRPVTPSSYFESAPIFTTPFDLFKEIETSDRTEASFKEGNFFGYTESQLTEQKLFHTNLLESITSDIHNPRRISQAALKRVGARVLRQSEKMRHLRESLPLYVGESFIDDRTNIAYDILRTDPSKELPLMVRAQSTVVKKLTVDLPGITQSSTPFDLMQKLLESNSQAQAPPKFQRERFSKGSRSKEIITAPAAKTNPKSAVVTLRDSRGRIHNLPQNKLADAFGLGKGPALPGFEGLSRGLSPGLPSLQTENALGELQQSQRLALWELSQSPHLIGQTLTPSNVQEFVTNHLDKKITSVMSRERRLPNTVSLSNFSQVNPETGLSLGEYEESRMSPLFDKRKSVVDLALGEGDTHSFFESLGIRTKRTHDARVKVVRAKAAGAGGLLQDPARMALRRAEENRAAAQSVFMATKRLSQVGHIEETNSLLKMAHFLGTTAGQRDLSLKVRKSNKKISPQALEGARKALYEATQLERAKAAARLLVEVDDLKNFASGQGLLADVNAILIKKKIPLNTGGTADRIAYKIFVKESKARLLAGNPKALAKYIPKLTGALDITSVRQVELLLPTLFSRPELLESTPRGPGVRVKGPGDLPLIITNQFEGANRLVYDPATKVFTQLGFSGADTVTGNIKEFGIRGAQLAQGQMKGKGYSAAEITLRQALEQNSRTLTELPVYHIDSERGYLGFAGDTGQQAAHVRSLLSGSSLVATDIETTGPRYGSAFQIGFAQSGENALYNINPNGSNLEELARASQHLSDADLVLVQHIEAGDLAKPAKMLRQKANSMALSLPGKQQRVRELTSAISQAQTRHQATLGHIEHLKRYSRSLRSDNPAVQNLRQSEFEGRQDENFRHLKEAQEDLNNLDQEIKHLRGERERALSEVASHTAETNKYKSAALRYESKINKTLDMRFLAPLADEGLTSGLSLQEMLTHLGILKPGDIQSHTADRDAAQTLEAFGKLNIKSQGEAIAQKIEALQKYNLSNLTTGYTYLSRNMGSEYSNRLFKVEDVRQAFDKEGNSVGYGVYLNEYNLEGKHSPQVIHYDSAVSFANLLNVATTGINEEDAFAIYSATADDYGRRLVRRVVSPDAQGDGNKLLRFETYDQQMKLAQMSPQERTAHKALYEQRMFAAQSAGTLDREAASHKFFLDLFEKDGRFADSVLATRSFHSQDFQALAPFYQSIQGQINTGEITRAQAASKVNSFTEEFYSRLGLAPTTVQTPPQLERLIPNLGMENLGSVRLNNTSAALADIRSLALRHASRDPQSLGEILTSVGVPADQLHEFTDHLAGIGNKSFSEQIEKETKDRLSKLRAKIADEAVRTPEFQQAFLGAGVDISGVRTAGEAARRAVTQREGGGQMILANQAVTNHLPGINSYSDMTQAHSLVSEMMGTQATKKIEESITPFRFSQQETIHPLALDHYQHNNFEAHTNLGDNFGKAQAMREAYALQEPGYHSRMHQSVVGTPASRVGLSLEGKTPEEVLQKFGNKGALALEKILDKEKGNVVMRSAIEESLGYNQGDIGQRIVGVPDTRHNSENRLLTLGDITQDPRLSVRYREYGAKPEAMGQVFEEFQAQTGRRYDPYTHGLTPLQEVVDKKESSLARETVANTNRQHIEALIESNQARPTGPPVHLDDSLGNARPLANAGVEGLEKMATRFAESIPLPGPWLAGVVALGTVALGAVSPNLNRRAPVRVTSLESVLDENLPDRTDHREQPRHFSVTARVRGALTGDINTKELVEALQQAGARHIDQSSGAIKKTQHIQDNREPMTRAKAQAALVKIIRR